MDFFARWVGELDDDDRTALDRPGFKLYESRGGDRGGRDETPSYHLIRVSAPTAEEARRGIVSALGREPEGLEVVYEAESYER